MTEIPKEEMLLKCPSTCAGCGSLLALRYILKAAGRDTVLVIPACCNSVIQGVYPYMLHTIPVYNIAFAAAAACASGMSEAFRAKGKKTNVIVYAGDGGTADIGIQALSGALEREEDFLYICYDNEAYGNTGMQRSGATPLGAITTTTPNGKRIVKKDLDRMIEAHNLPYQATACASYPADLYNKVKKAISIPGPKFIHILAPCPPGWKTPSEKTVEVGKLAVKSGIWVLWEKEYDKLTISAPSKAAMKRPVPVTDYLSMQGRYKKVDAALAAQIQANVDKNLRKMEAEVKISEGAL
ncbi:MAG TPA: thiamine pyrophosphate-dependent enzyme [Methanocorpusculum sp.]|nr:pyruvate synthase subunit beta [Candidatus Methanocorpusculum equi]MCQ2357186.1 thiamine pyrophosphate-dependent enzyme [Methanocorpusculum sp.]HJJ33579.1 thiamine pyrophosphate-dependent enzyme [Methanocorpusculum sp.]HJJ44389.1 thiamine pyrophosphate-dependent enzyme [Methanocorpusculum sp.]HJJ57944.1 thiamine pyrophosphate-dependent enzyme [Methanocorpusculum sp.]